MNHPKPLPPLKELEEVFQLSEDYASGLAWKINPSKQGGKKAGSQAGYLSKQGSRYWRVKYQQKLYPCHRIRWSLINKRLILPHEYVDHADGNTKENRGELRLVNLSQNQYNRSRKKATSGYRWVVYTKANPKKPWRIIIRINGQSEFFGYYSDAREAALKADQLALEKLDINYARLNFPEVQLKNKE